MSGFIGLSHTGPVAPALPFAPGGGAPSFGYWTSQQPSVEFGAFPVPFAFDATANDDDARPQPQYYHNINKIAQITGATEEERRARLGERQLLFERSDTVSAVNGSFVVDESRGWEKPTGWVAKKDHVSDLLTLPMLNAKLQSESARAIYGSERSCRKLMNEWKFAGVQLHNETDRASMPPEFQSIALCASGKTQTWNIWHTTLTSPMSQNAGLFLLVKKKSFKSLADDLLGDTRLSGGSGNASTKRRLVNGVVVSVVQDVDTQPQQQQQAQQQDTSHYWQIEPYFSNSRDKPSRQLYTGKDANGKGWVGDYIYIGRVIHLYSAVYADGEIAPDHEVVKQFVFPLSTDNSYKSVLEKNLIPRMEIAVRMR